MASLQVTVFVQRFRHIRGDQCHPLADLDHLLIIALLHEPIKVLECCSVPTIGTCETNATSDGVVLEFGIGVLGTDNFHAQEFRQERVVVVHDGEDVVVPFSGQRCGC